MPCACSGRSSSQYNVEVTFRDQSKRVFSSKSEARLAINAAGGGGTMRQVLKSTHPVSK